MTTLIDKKTGKEYKVGTHDGGKGFIPLNIKELPLMFKILKDESDDRVVVLREIRNVTAIIATFYLLNFSQTLIV
jgi:hypothetical protein